MPLNPEPPSPSLTDPDSRNLPDIISNLKDSQAETLAHLHSLPTLAAELASFPATLPVEQVQRLLGLTRSTISKYTMTGLLIRTRHNTYDTASVLQFRKYTSSDLRAHMLLQKRRSPAHTPRPRFAYGILLANPFMNMKGDPLPETNPFLEAHHYLSRRLRRTRSIPDTKEAVIALIEPDFTRSQEGQWFIELLQSKWPVDNLIFLPESCRDTPTSILTVFKTKEDFLVYLRTKETKEDTYAAILQDTVDRSEEAAPEATTPAGRILESAPTLREAAHGTTFYFLEENYGAAHSQPLSRPQLFLEQVLEDPDDLFLPPAMVEEIQETETEVLEYFRAAVREYLYRLDRGQIPDHVLNTFYVQTNINLKDFNSILSVLYPEPILLSPVGQPEVYASRSRPQLEAILDRADTILKISK